MGEGRDDKRKPRSDADCVVYGISSYNSNSMKSGNPYSGIYVAETARTLDLNGGSPDCNQGGMLVLQRRVYERHDQDARYKLLANVSETVSAKYGTGGGNTPIVVETLVFDTTQVTSPINYSHPTWNDSCHPLASSQHPPTVIIK